MSKAKKSGGGGTIPETADKPVKASKTAKVVALRPSEALTTALDAVAAIKTDRTRH